MSLIEEGARRGGEAVGGGGGVVITNWFKSFIRILHMKNRSFLMERNDHCGCFLG